MLDAYACYIKNESIREQSSSGAVFSALASLVISENGIVYGVAMSDDYYSAEFIRIDNEKDLFRMRGSKYLQAVIGDTFKKVKCDLDNGMKVLFTGTGCQINGLIAFLGGTRDNLICVDVICHGVPSPLLWRKYVEYREKTIGKLENLNFRCKDEGWDNFGVKENQQYISLNNHSYMQMFLRNYCLRPSCYNCTAKKIKNSDITIADFWGIDFFIPEMNDKKGTSLVIVRTDKGKKIFEEISSEMNVRSVSYEEGISNNPSEYKSVARPTLRDEFFVDLETISFEEMIKKYATPVKVSFIQKVKTKIKIMLSVNYRKIKRKIALIKK